MYLRLVPVFSTYYLLVNMPQFRKDPVSGEWIIMAPERAKRPENFKKKRVRPTGDLKSCPFEDLKKTGNWPPILQFPEKGDWRMVVVANKYPALEHKNECPVAVSTGPYESMEGVGYHELLITRDHRKDFGGLPPQDALQVFKMFAKRYAGIDKDSCMAYLSIFGNWGPASGASIAHPHYQMMALPIVPPIVMRSYEGSEKYFKKYKRCIHCELVDFERKAKVRVVDENSSAIAIAPFVSYSPYEVKIFPKGHATCFEHSTDYTWKGVAELLQGVIRKMKRKLNDPDYNFYIHTGPLKNQSRYKHYHWHIEISPRVTLAAGFEFATGIDVNVVSPEMTAKILR